MCSICLKNNVKIGLNGALYSGTQKISVGNVEFSHLENRIVAVPDYNCGQILEIKNLFITWQT
jgi:hypothetical protein